MFTGLGEGATGRLASRRRDRFPIRSGARSRLATRIPREGGALPSGPYSWSRPSDKGRYLIGVLKRFGGLHESGAVLLHRYWKSVFEELGGAISAHRHDDIKRALKKQNPHRAHR